MWSVISSTPLRRTSLGFNAARGRGEAPENMGLPGMARYVDEGAQAFRGAPQTELIARFRDAREQMYGIVDGLTEDEWAGLMVPHKYMGPLPARVLSALPTR